ncbi:MAG: Gx transporter family protein [Lachnospiraceae bacterium]|nr:Gx transporter family protein [Lachnospiraceae bacterium]
MSDNDNIINDHSIEKSTSGKVAFKGLLLAFALILSYVESLIPFYFGIPGAKLGLANLAVVLCLYLFSAGTAITVNILRIILSGFLFGNMFSILYSLAGALFSFVIMLGLKKSGKFSIYGVSVAGGVFHNVGQIMIAAWVVQTVSIVFYLPVLLMAGLLTGLLIGIIASRIMPYVSQFKERIK